MKKNGKTTKMKNNKIKANKVSSMICIVAAILIVLGVGGYFLGNEVLPSGGFNASVKVPVTGVKFPNSTYTVAYSEVVVIPVNIQPSNATDKGIACTSSAPSIARVYASGTNCVVRGFGVGTATVTVTTTDGKKTAVTNIAVYKGNGPVKVTGIKFNDKSDSVSVGESKNLATTLTPSNATNKEVVCTSSNTSIATISTNGSNCIVKGVKAGTATITVKTKDGSKTATITVTVKEKTTNSATKSTTSTTPTTSTTTTPSSSKKVRVKFAEFNVGYFSCGSDAKANCRASVSDLSKWIKANKIDVLGMQEARDAAKNTDKTVNCPYRTYNIFSLKNQLSYNITTTCPNNVDAILSKYAFQGKPVVTHLGGARDITKVVLKINGVNISFYNSHLGLNESNEAHFKKVAEIVAKDPNPIVMTADWNNHSLARFQKYLVNNSMGFVIAGYDTSKNNMWGKPSYCDTVLVNPKGHIDIVSSEVIEAYRVYSDHNMVAVTLDIY